MKSLLFRLVTYTLLVSTLCALPAASQVDPANPANPYDVVGLRHNQGLDYVIQARGDVGTDLVPLTFAAAGYAVEFGCGAANVRCANTDTFFTSAARITAFQDTVRAEVAAQMNEVQAGYFRQLLTVVDEHGNDSPVLVAKMKAVEDQILASSLSHEEAMPLLMAASVGRYSATYWNREASDPNSKWNAAAGVVLGEILDGDTTTITGADLTGAIIAGGAALGSGVGSAGALDAAIAGGLTASLAAALDALWDWLF